MKWLQRMFGVDQIYEQINKQHQELSAIKGQVIASNRGMGRLIAKLDPLYAADELDPIRKKQSDETGAGVIKKLIAEHIESNKLSGKT